jgi:hypothetical protein
LARAELEKQNTDTSIAAVIIIIIIIIIIIPELHTRKAQYQGNKKQPN